MNTELPKNYNQKYIEDYNRIMDNKSVVVTVEWEKSGDMFKRLSMYDESYTTYSTLGNTTLINQK